MRKVFISIWTLCGKFKYVIVVVFALIFIGFLDDNSIVQRLKNQQELNELRAEINKYESRHLRDSALVKRLERDSKTMHKIARERYYMKAKDEDIFVFSEDAEKEIQQENDLQ